MAAVGFFQVLLDLTVEESLTKYGFRYVAADDWGRLRRLFRQMLVLKLVGGALATVILVAFAPFANELFGEQGVERAILAAALLPFVQAPENVGSTALLLHSRYDLRGMYQAGSAGLRLVAIVAFAPSGVTAALVAVVVAQAVSSSVISFAGVAALRRFPSGAGASTRRGCPRHPLLRRPVEPRDGRHLAPDDARPADRRRRRRADAGRPLPHRAGAADGARRCELAGPADAPDGADARLGARRASPDPRGRAQLLEVGGGRDARRRPAVPRDDALARRPRLRQAVPRGRRRGSHHPARGGRAVRHRLDEDAAGHDRPSATADRHARSRGDRGDPARRRARGEVGRDGRRRRRPRLHTRVRRRLARWSCCGCATRCAPPSPRAGPRCPREDRRRVRHLASRSGWPREPCPRARRLPRRARSRGRGRDHRRCRARCTSVSGSVGGAALALPAPARDPARPRRCPARRRRVRDEHDPARCSRRAPRTPSARRQARVGRGLRASDAPRRLRGDARRVPAPERRSPHARSQGRAQPSAAERATRLLPERVPARRRARLGARSETGLGAPEPRAGGARPAAARGSAGRAGAPRGRARVRGPARSAEGPRGGSRRARGGRGRVARGGRGRARSGRPSSGAPPSSGSPRASGSTAASRASASCASSGRRTPPCSRRRGRTSRTRSWRRSRSGAPSSRPRSAGCRRSSGTARTACSSRPTTPLRLRRRSLASAATPSSARACRRRRRDRSRPTPRRPSSARSRPRSQRVAGS